MSRAIRGSKNSDPAATPTTEASESFNNCFANFRTRVTMKRRRKQVLSEAGSLMIFQSDKNYFACTGHNANVGGAFSFRDV